MNFSIRFLLLIQSMVVLGQDIDTIPAYPLDHKYREDHFYFGVTYNTLQKRPSGLSQNAFSAGVAFGFLRDIPLTSNRRIAIAPGAGVSIQGYNQNLLVTRDERGMNYELLPGNRDFKKNRFSLFMLELPFEVRWRNSTPESHKFWRIYSGFKVSYLFFDNTRFITGQEKIILDNNPDLQKWHYGIYMAVGYNTWNFYIYYGLNPLFRSSAQLEGQSIEMNALSLGLQFYIL